MLPFSFFSYPVINYDNFLHAVDNVYENLPFQRKIVLSKDNFKNMMVKMKEEYHENKGVITDQQLEKLIVEAYSTKDLKD